MIECSMLTSKDCAGCVAMKTALKSIKINFKAYDRETPEGTELANKYGLHNGVPVLVFRKGNGQPYFINGWDAQNFHRKLNRIFVQVFGMEAE